MRLMQEDDREFNDDEERLLALVVDRGMTIDAAAKRMKIAPDRARNIYAKAVEKLKKEAMNHGHRIN